MVQNIYTACENFTSEHSLTQENRWKIAHANFSIRGYPQFFLPLILPLPQFLAFRKKSFESHFNGDLRIKELPSFFGFRLTHCDSNQAVNAGNGKKLACGKCRNSSLSD